jgi:hypothetical protein
VPLEAFLLAFHFLLSGVFISLVWSFKKLRILWRHFLVGLCVILFAIESSHNRVVHPFGRHSIVEHARLDVLMNVSHLSIFHFLHKQAIQLVLVSIVFHVWCNS